MKAQPRSGRAVSFDVECTLCPRLSDHLAAVRGEWPDHYSRPVPAFGPVRAKLHIVGLAPGLHGANRTGRVFTGDGAGMLLYETLYKFGLCTQPVSQNSRDGMRLHGCRITNAVKCLPPKNRPNADEIRVCNRYLQSELSGVPSGGVILVLGALAHRAVVLALGLRLKDYPFGHGNEFALSRKRSLVDSFHCSRYNTQTGRLTGAMFAEVVGRAHALARI